MSLPPPHFWIWPLPCRLVHIFSIYSSRLLSIVVASALYYIYATNFLNYEWWIILYHIITHFPNSCYCKLSAQHWILSKEPDGVIYPVQHVEELLMCPEYLRDGGKAWLRDQLKVSEAQIRQVQMQHFNSMIYLIRNCSITPLCGNNIHDFYHFRWQNWLKVNAAILSGHWYENYAWLLQTLEA